MGNPVLLLRLCDNLLQNAFAASQHVAVAISGTTVTLRNQGLVIPEKVLRKLNNGKKLAVREYQGSGQGLIICREIMQRHQGSLGIQSTEGATVVRLTFS